MWEPPDPISGFSREVTPPERRPEPGTDRTLAVQRQVDELRVTEGRTTPSVWDQTADEKRRAMLKVASRGRG